MYPKFSFRNRFKLFGVEAATPSGTANSFCDELPQEHRAEAPGLSVAREKAGAVPGVSVRRNGEQRFHRIQTGNHDEKIMIACSYSARVLSQALAVYFLHLPDYKIFPIFETFFFYTWSNGY